MVHGIGGVISQLMWAIPRSQTRSQDPDCLKLCHLGQIEMCTLKDQKTVVVTQVVRKLASHLMYTNMCIYIQIYVYIRIYITIFIYFVHVIPFQTAILPHRLELRRTFVASPGPLPPKTAPQWPSTPSPDTPRGGERSVAGGRGFFIKGGFFPKKHVGQFLGDGFLKHK